MNMLHVIYKLATNENKGCFFYQRNGEGNKQENWKNMRI